MSTALLITKGHPFDKAAFFAVFDALIADPDCELTDYTHVEQPAARVFFDPARAEPWDVFVMYDMPGLVFGPDYQGLEFEEQSEELMTGTNALLEAGKGMVFLHHALAGWPSWEDWARIMGGRFHYRPAVLDGVEYPDSGYHHDVTHTVEVLDASHPIVAGVPDRFEITDEVYLAAVLEGAVEPLLRSTHEFTAANFWSADAAIRGKLYNNEGWSHPEGSSLVGWTKHAGNSPVAYLQFGDTAQTYADANYRLLVGNAINWATSNGAYEWARARREARGTFA